MTQRRPILSMPVGLLFLLPAMVFVAVFLVFPSLWVLWISLTNQTLTGEAALRPRFVGLANFRALFDFENWMVRGYFGNALRNSVLFVIGSALIGQAGLGLAIAWAFYRRRGIWRELIYTLAILAWIIPDVVVAFMWVAYLDRDQGTLNAILSALGMGRVDWLIEQPLLSIIIFNTWRGAAFSMLLFSSALATLPPSYLEAAAVAGARPWQAFRDIILPSIRSHIITDLVLITLWTFNTFTPYLITAGGPTFRSEVVSIYTFRIAFQHFEFGRGAAVAVVMMLINLALALVYLSTLRREARAR
ncbi:Inner membrane ABC transporter permease protein YcjO [Candidatus Thermoflexus japonica]|uniref:Inner membrane ABC transporter permease protein YcjO n=1 Tax=Candidatus Thermoflexus japonica TaxID=2035417 RepID=A0A2H5Y6R5_9CHLR|nr:Inner membrane ABC transporter permease protein YcjO [Candidatus Thermoflexus japonica]